MQNNSGDTVICDAAIYNKDSLKLLIEKFGEKVLEVKDSKGYTPLQLAAIYHREAFKLLIEKLPKTALSLFTEKNRDGNTALHLAIQDNKGDLLKLVIEKYPEIIKNLLDMPDTAGNTPLHFSTGNKGAFKLLIDNFPEQVKNLFYVENKFGKTVLKYANSECPNALPKEYRDNKESWGCVILGNKDSIPIPGIPESFSSYYQDQVSLLLKLRLEDAAPGALNSVNVLAESYTLREGNEDYIAAKLSLFILASEKDTILMPLNIGGSHLIGMAAVKDGNKIVIHYMDSELALPPESLLMKIGSMLQSHSY